jgi:hypothetical protein
MHVSFNFWLAVQWIAVTTDGSNISVHSDLLGWILSTFDGSNSPHWGAVAILDDRIIINQIRTAISSVYKYNKNLCLHHLHLQLSLHSCNWLISLSLWTLQKRDRKEKKKRERHISCFWKRMNKQERKHDWQSSQNVALSHNVLNYRKRFRD